MESAAHFSWIQLTDSHYGLSGHEGEWPNLREPFLSDLEMQHERSGPWNVVFFTGDLVQSGQSEQFERMQEHVLNRIWKKLDELGSGGAAFLAVPGNHDLFRPDPQNCSAAMDTLLRKGGFEAIAEKFWKDPPGDYRNAISEVFKAYSKWWDETPRRPQITQGLLPGDFAATLRAGPYSIGVVGLNTTFLQLQPGNFEGHLVWSGRQISAACGEIDD